MMDFDPLVAAVVASVSSVVILLLLVFTSIREKKITSELIATLKSTVSGYESQMRTAMMLIKSDNTMEAIHADNEDKQADIRVQYLQDALAQAEHDTKGREPLLVSTTDGRKFSMDELEVL